jgi:hypothetical protein
MFKLYQSVADKKCHLWHRCLVHSNNSKNIANVRYHKIPTIHITSNITVTFLSEARTTWDSHQVREIKRMTKKSIEFWLASGVEHRQFHLMRPRNARVNHGKKPRRNPQIVVTERSNEVVGWIQATFFLGRQLLPVDSRRSLSRWPPLWRVHSHHIIFQRGVLRHSQTRYFSTFEAWNSKVQVFSN